MKKSKVIKSKLSKKNYPDMKIKSITDEKEEPLNEHPN